jgi:hypothetical protein
MTCRCAPALVRLDKEVTARYPDRDQRSDGCCGDAAHQARKSDHNARTSGPAKGYAVAADVDEDLTPTGPGPDDLTGLLFHLYGRSEAEADPRVRQIIYEDFLYYPHSGPKARGKYAYTGINPHRQHLHVGIFDWAWNDMGLWLPQEDDDMTPEETTVLADAWVRDSYRIKGQPLVERDVRYWVGQIVTGKATYGAVRDFIVKA